MEENQEQTNEKNGRGGMTYQPITHSGHLLKFKRKYM
jgi:hypothetical protein